MRIELLEEYLVFVRCLNFSKASVELSISQSALSKHISALEKEFATQLVQRGEKISLTQSGSLLIKHAQKIIDAYHAAHDEIGAKATNTPVRLLWFESPRLLDLLRKETSIPFSFSPFYESEGASYFSSIIAGKTDIVSLPLIEHLPALKERADNSGITIRPIGFEPLSIAISRHHPLYPREQISASDLNECSVLMPDPATFEEWRAVLASLFGSANLDFELNPVDGNMDNIAFADLGDRMFIYQSHLIDEYFSDREDVRIIRELDGQPILLHQMIAYRRDNPNPNVKLLADFLATHSEPPESL